MNKYFIWFKIDGDISAVNKGQISAAIHSYIFNNENGKKLKTKSNAFFYWSDESEGQIVEKIKNMANENIKLFVVQLDGATFQGWLPEENWEFIDEN